MGFLGYLTRFLISRAFRPYIVGWQVDCILIRERHRLSLKEDLPNRRIRARCSGRRSKSGTPDCEAEIVDLIEVVNCPDDNLHW